jgi:hypothetical protein
LPTSATFLQQSQAPSGEGIQAGFFPNFSMNPLTRSYCL